ncbi:MAG: GTPase ObgE [Clostridia bacterium]
MFIDKAVITIISGKGGNGCKSFKSYKGKPFGGADGGDGGRGGNIIFKVDGQMNNLVDYKFHQHFRAGNGTNGTSSLCFGKGGEDVVIKVPRGTIIRDKETDNIIADMFYDDQEVVVLEGGRAGKGNAKFVTATRKAPMFAQLGEDGIDKQVILELKTIADVGFCGFPNVGKSTLLSVLTNATPKIANYPFTTISPNLGMFQMNHENFILADIPGIIEGASEGAGLGLDFLKHIERTRMIVHIVDISGEDGRDPYEDYVAIRHELKSFSQEMATRPEIVVANKIDSDYDGEKLKKFKERMGNKPVLAISAVLHDGIEELKKVMYEELKQLDQIKPIEFEKFSYARGEGDEYEIGRDDDGAYTVFGTYIDNLARNVVIDDTQSLAYMQKSLKMSGVIKALRKAGAVEGDTVRILGVEFDFMD